MTPYEKLEKAYADRPREEPFENYIRWHLRHGFVFARPDFCAIGRPVIRAAGREAILDSTHLFTREDCDAWYVFAGAGDLRKMWQILPWPLGWVCWTRLQDPQGELTFVETERLQRLCPPDLSRLQ